jgi:hypothetical protein
MNKTNIVEILSVYEGNKNASFALFIKENEEYFRTLWRK